MRGTRRYYCRHVTSRFNESQACFHPLAIPLLILVKRSLFVACLAAPPCKLFTCLTVFLAAFIGQVRRWLGNALTDCCAVYVLRGRRAPARPRWRVLLPTHTQRISSSLSRTVLEAPISSHLAFLPFVDDNIAQLGSRLIPRPRFEVRQEAAVRSRAAAVAASASAAAVQLSLFCRSTTA